MKTVITIDGQTIYDLAVQHYGNMEAIAEILELNPDIRNDAKGVNADLSEFWLDLPIAAGTVLTIDDSSYLQRKNITREITEPVTTFEPWQEV